MAPHQAVLDEAPPGGAPPETWRLEIAAVLESTTHISGIGWRLSAPDGADTVHTQTRRYGRTLLYSELAAVRGGLEAARHAGCRRLVVDVPEPVVAALLRGEHVPRFRRAEKVAAGLRPRLAGFDSVTFESGRPTHPELAHAVGEALDAGLHAAAEREEYRVLVMERTIERARSVELAEHHGEWIANGRYRVRLEPMHCDCPAWTARWARAPIPGRRAQRLPCKHLVALALHEGVTVPADLVALARRAPL